MSAAKSTSREAPPLLEVRGLTVWAGEYPAAPRPILEGIQLDLHPGETLIVTGPSGSGKTTLALAILGLMPCGSHRAYGSIRFQEEELLTLPPEDWRRLRGRGLMLVPQDPHAALNPLRTIGSQLIESLTSHGFADRRQARERALEACGELGLENRERWFDERPGVLSGGMKQRVCLAMALLLTPRLLVLDEPTAHLDWETREEVLDSIDRVASLTGAARIWMTHDDAVQARYAKARHLRLAAARRVA